MAKPMCAGRHNHELLTWTVHASRPLCNLVLTLLGIIPLLLAFIPVVAILPILLYIGLSIGAQAFTESPARHAPAIILALIPHLAAWAKAQIDSALAAANTSAALLGQDSLAQAGVLYEGLTILGGGAILTSVIWAGFTIAVIDQKSRSAIGFGLAGAVLSFLGLIHGESVGWAVSIELALVYLLISCLVFITGKRTLESI